MGLLSQSKTLTQNFSCVKELQGQKWKKAWGKGHPMRGPKWDSGQVEAPRPDITTEDMECAQKGAYHYCHPKDPTSTWKSQMLIFIFNQWTEAGNPCGWIWENLGDEEMYDPLGGPAVSINLNLWDLSDTGPPTMQHTLAYMRPPTHIQQRTARSGFSQRRCT